MKGMTGKFAANASIDNIVSFITREWHILQFLVSLVRIIILKHKTTESMILLRLEANLKHQKYAIDPSNGM